MAITNTTFKIAERDRRGVGDGVHTDYVTQPRLLQPVVVVTDVTLANGFTPANLKPGDLLFVEDGAVDADAEYWIRNGANNGWHVIETLAANDQADA